MFTVCPKCTLTLAVTAGDLRVGQGYVRCGRCSNVFNALLQLTEEPVELHASPAASPPARAPLPLPLSSVPPAAGTAPAAAAASTPRRASAPASAAPAAPAPASAAVGTASTPAPTRVAPARVAPPAPATSAPPAVASGARVAARSAPRAPPASAHTEDATDEFHIDDIDFPATTGTFESILLEGDAITRTEGVIPEPTAPAPNRRPTHGASPSAAASSRASAARAFAARVAAQQTSTPEPSITTDEAPAEEALSDEAAQAKAIAAVLQPSSERRGWAWIVLCALLLILLIAQLVDHWRNALAASPFWSAPLAGIYDTFGVPLAPRWDLGAYDVRQQGAQSDPSDPHVIRVRLSVSNHSTHSQPLPLLRLTLLDRYGKHIAARDLTPVEYWPHGRPLDRFLGSDQRIDSEVAVRTATSDSSSFEIDVCLRDAAGSVRCAGETDGVAAAGGTAAGSGA